MPFLDTPYILYSPSLLCKPAPAVLAVPTTYLDTVQGAAKTDLTEKAFIMCLAFPPELVYHSRQGRIVQDKPQD